MGPVWSEYWHALRLDHGRWAYPDQPFVFSQSPSSVLRNWKASHLAGEARAIAGTQESARSVRATREPITARLIGSGIGKDSPQLDSFCRTFMASPFRWQQDQRAGPHLIGAIGRAVLGEHVLFQW